ncbi:MAG: hypothetical protein ABSF38_14840 [Verrucomicrobiota bacterium]|jgi:tetratricopeptide (TPR) repeat protein
MTKRLSCQLLFWWAAVCLAPAGLAQSLNTNASHAGLSAPATNATNASLAAAAGVKTPAGPVPAPAILPANPSTRPSRIEGEIQLAREQRHQQEFSEAAVTLESVLQADAPAELHRQALFERALVAQDNAQPVKAQQIWAQYLHLYSSDPSVPDVLLRQGLLYRDMGVHTLAISKFYAVMSSALKLQLGSLDFYKKLVLRAQTEIAETYFMDARFDEAAEYYHRILITGDAEDEDREQLECKLLRAMSHLTNSEDIISAIGRGQTFLRQYPNSSDVPEVRFMLAAALTRVGRNQDSMKQVLLLLQAEQENVNKEPETWLYWQRRAGNEIANQLYKEGDFLDALQIYLSLADLDQSLAWQFPVWYQTGLDYEQLQQWQMATDTYNRILGRQKELNPTNSTPMLSGIVEMAKWRRDYIAWQLKARESNLALHYSAPTNAAPEATP